MPRSILGLEKVGCGPAAQGQPNPDTNAHGPVYTLQYRPNFQWLLPKLVQAASSADAIDSSELAVIAS
jgi:hypothetical protein